MKARAWALPLAVLLSLSLPRKAAPDETAPVAQKAQQFLSRHCARCHAGGRDEGGLASVLDARRLVDTKRVVPGKPGDSELFRLVSTRKMPDDRETKPTDDEIADLRAWIEAGAPSFSPATPSFPPDAVLAAIKADLLALEKADRPFARYLTLAHLANAGRSPDEIAAASKALSKLVNGLSWKKEIVAPVAIDPAKAILRIDLRKYDWTAKTWEKISAAHPYGLVFESGPGKDCAAETGTPSFMVRGDWFLAGASRAPLYHEVLELPSTDRELEKLLGIDVDANILSRAARRVGSYTSGESDYNRVIERHATAHGAYWKAYDFRDGDGVRDVFPNPLGPGNGERDFTRDGSEIIFHLPNGLQAYMVVDGKGSRLDRAPTGACWNKEARDGSIRTATAITCMSCHLRGVTERGDGTRGWYLGHAIRDKTLFDKKLLETVTALYPERGEMSDLFEQDAKTYKTAVEAAGSFLPRKTEPLVALAHDFDAGLDRRLAAAELGLSPEALQEKLKATPVAALAQLAGDGTVARAAFQKAFPEALAAWGLGKHDGHEQAPLSRVARSGDRIYETAVADGVLSVELDSRWSFEGRRGGLVLSRGEVTRLKISAERTKLKDLEAVSAREKEALAQRLREVKTAEHPQLGKAVLVHSDALTPNVQMLDEIALLGTWLVRLSVQCDARTFDRDRKELEGVLASVKLDAPEELDPIHRDLPEKLKAAGFEGDYKAALARAKA
ncbi:hypothetical protein HY251_16530, partial [bacterium]|nr:hypothetical protein [bacterium]